MSPQAPTHPIEPPHTVPMEGIPYPTTPTRRHILIRRYLRQSLPHAQFYRFKHFWERKTQGIHHSPTRTTNPFHDAGTSPHRTLNAPITQAKTFLQSVGFALEGLRFMYETQRNLRIDCAIVLITLVLGGMVGLSFTQWSVLLLAQGMLLLVEGLNTLLEWWVDWQTQGTWDLRAKRLKDVSAGLCLMNACLVGLMILGVFLSKAGVY
ncbi:MAG: diacylglycerol kinase [Vampirovibrionales bacterium]